MRVPPLFPSGKDYFQTTTTLTPSKETGCTLSTCAAKKKNPPQKTPTKTRDNGNCRKQHFQQALKASTSQGSQIQGNKTLLALDDLKYFEA